FNDPAEIISWMGGIQGQDYSGSKWGVGLRLTPGIKDVDLDHAMTEKSILRTWLMRGTLHLVAAKDIQWMLELLSPKIIKNNTRRYRELELDENTLKRSNQVLQDVLRGDKQLSRKELLFILNEQGISTEGQRAAYILQRASLNGLICQCAVERNDPVYISMDMIPKTKTLEREEALAELARRYYQSRGPATAEDFIWWSGLWADDARTGLEMVKSEFKSETIGKKIYWRPDITIRNIPPVAHLLPTYDEYVIGYRDRMAFLAETNKIKLQNHFQPTIIINGQIIGTWKRILKKGSIFMDYFPFKKLNTVENRLLTESENIYSEFMNLPVKQSGKQIKENI
ncbi:MAG TPA: winged helix DNA-binding domain-containing protein, partial [Methanobacterium sp.]|nr:winged helix DNA-binding domain-containing protein [Methanobacterium sp.]